MKHLFSCLKFYKKETVLAPLFKLLEASMELIVPLVVASIVSRGIATGDEGYIVKMCLVLVAFGVVGLAFALIAQYFAAKAAVGVSAALRGKLFDKLQGFSFAQIDEMGASTMITRMTSDINQVQTGINMTLRLFLRSPFIVFGAMIMAFVVDARAALVFAIVIPLLAIVVYAVMGACIPLYHRVQTHLDQVYHATRENLQGVRVVRAFSLEDEEREDFAQACIALKKSQKKAGRVAALTNPLTYILLNLAVIALLYVCAKRVDLGILEQGAVIALYGYLSQILVELIKLANLIVTMTKAVSCQKRIERVLDMPQESSILEGDLHTEQTGEVVFDDVTFCYEGSQEPALEHISFTAKKGETVGVLGGTGSGKSTLVRLISRDYPCTQGGVFVAGQNVKQVPVKKLREKIAIVPQKTVLFKGSIKSNLLWGRENATDEQLNRAIALAQAEDVVKAKGGLDSEIEQEGKNLSGGQRQRLAIARALVKEGEILILDDSSSALDYATDARLRQSLKTLDCTLFLVSQRASTVRHADKILVLDDGMLVGVGTHEELLSSCEVYQEIYRSQTQEEV